VKPPSYYFRSALSDVGARLNKRYYKGLSIQGPSGRASWSDQRTAWPVAGCPRSEVAHRASSVLPQYDQKQLMGLHSISQIRRLEESRRAHWRAYVRGRA
jgi:hypothetical protein